MKSIYERIRDLRTDNDLTQQNIADKLGLYKTQYCRYETGLSTVPFEFIIEIAKFYNVSIDYIAGLTNEYRKLY